MVGAVTQLYASDPYYKTKSINFLTDVTIPALALNRYKVWVKDKKLIGFCVWAFATEKEIEADDWTGAEILSKNDGEEIRIVHFMCHGGKRETLLFVNHIRRTLSKQYPQVKFATASRRKLNGSVRPHKWYRKETQ